MAFESAQNAWGIASTCARARDLSSLFGVHEMTPDFGNVLDTRHTHWVSKPSKTHGF